MEALGAGIHISLSVRDTRSSFLDYELNRLHFAKRYGIITSSKQNEAQGAEPNYVKFPIVKFSSILFIQRRLVFNGGWMFNLCSFSVF